MIESLILAKQEIDIITWIIEKSRYSESEEKVTLPLRRFTGKHFRNYSTIEELYERVIEVSIFLKKRQYISGFSIEDEKIAPDMRITFDIKGLVDVLNQYNNSLKNEIRRNELQKSIKKGNYCWLDEQSKTLYFTLPNGTTKPITLWTSRAKTQNIYLLMKVLYCHWIDFYEQVLTKNKLRTELSTLGWSGVTDKELKEHIKNLRDTKIKPAGLAEYIKITFDRKEQGYKVCITYP